MDKQRVYKRIHDIAHELNKDKSTMTRADLAYELNDDGIEKDSYEVGRLVYEAYNHYKGDAVIKNAFYNNENCDLLVSEYQIDSLIENNECDSLFPLVRRNDNGDGEEHSQHHCRNTWSREGADRGKGCF